MSLRGVALLACILVAACGDDTHGGVGGGAGSGGTAGTGGNEGGAGGDGAGGEGGFVGPTDLPFRFANMRSDGPPLNACVSTGPAMVFDGPLLDTPLAPGEVEPHFEVRVDGDSLLRWVDGSTCAPLAEGATDIPLVLNDAERYTAVAFGDDSLQTLVYESDPVAELSPARFYVRFFHGGLNLDPVDSKQVACSTPVAAFENVRFGTLGFSPNNMATFFSAAVSTGMDSFSTTVVVCENMNEVFRQDYVFVGGRSVSFFLRGDGDAVPHQVTVCEDDDVGAARCGP